MRRKLTYTSVGSVNQYSHCVSQYGKFSKLNIGLPYNDLVYYD